MIFEVNIFYVYYPDTFRLSVPMLLLLLWFSVVVESFRKIQNMYSSRRKSRRYAIRETPRVRACK